MNPDIKIFLGKTVVFVVLAFLAFLFVHEIFKSYKAKSDLEHKKTIDSLNLVIYTREADIKKSEGVVVALKDSIVKLELVKDRNNQYISKIQTDASKKINAISDYSDSSLIGFFTSRYHQ